MTMPHRLHITKDTRPGREHLHRMRGFLRPGEKQFDRSYSSEDAAKTARTKLEGDANRVVDLPTEVVTEARLAHDLLTHSTNDDAKGKSLLFAVRWFVAHYKNTAGELTVNEYADLYLELMRAKLAAATVQEATYYLTKFRETFGNRKPSAILVEELEAHLKTLKHRFYRDKVLRGYFRWLAGGKRKKLPVMKDAPLATSPFVHIIAPPIPTRKTRPQILTMAEVKTLLKFAAERGTLDYFVAGLFLGLRPESELVPFLSSSDELIDHDTEEVVLTASKVPQSIERDIHIRPGLKKYLGKRSKMELPVNWVKRVRETKRCLPEAKRMEHDLLRHTYLSNLAVAEGLTLAALEGGTSVKKLKKNYWKRVSKPQATAFFEYVPPTRRTNAPGTRRTGRQHREVEAAVADVAAGR